MQAQASANQIFDQACRHHQAGQLSQARALFAQLLQAQPGHPVLNARMANICQQQAQVQQALKHYELATKGLPQELQLFMAAADLALKVADHTRARHWLEHLAKAQPDASQIKEQLAGVYVALGLEQEALSILKSLLKQTPHNANALNLKGMVLCRLGDIDKGYKSFQKALKQAPGHLGVVRNLVLYGKGRKEPVLEQVIDQLAQQLRTVRLAPEQQMNIAYILFMYFEKRDAQKAFAFLKQGNDINKARTPYDHDQSQVMFGALCQLFDAELINACEGQGLSDAAPIFILGMPRSGTTLIEQILSSHSQVEAQGEIDDLRIAFEHHSNTLLSDHPSPLEAKVVALTGIANDYLGAVRERCQATHFTDKMPYNFMLVGVIASIMPKAKIIHCTRDAQETCYSIYKQNFSGTHAYTNDLEDVGKYFNLYQSMMAYWQEHFGAQIYEANYEALINQPREQIAALLEYCGLVPEEACFEFQRNKRAVRTASVAQVRQAIYKDALKASTAVENQLAPLREVLASGEGGELKMAGELKKAGELKVEN